MSICRSTYTFLNPSTSTQYMTFSFILEIPNIFPQISTLYLVIPLLVCLVINGTCRLDLMLRRLST
ncbi:hypothetical protein Lal_00010827 [Lupinus albus]|nr:hypothetical protein Lal_00010827 [Lupinus albus]